MSSKHSCCMHMFCVLFVEYNYTPVSCPPSINNSLVTRYVFNDYTNDLASKLYTCLKRQQWNSRNGGYHQGTKWLLNLLDRFIYVFSIEIGCSFLFCCHSHFENSATLFPCGLQSFSLYPLLSLAPYNLSSWGSVVK